MKTCKELIDFLDCDTCWSVINVYDESLNEMSRFGKLPNSQLEIHIEGSEGNIPHFHVQVKNGKPENCICHVKFLSAEYLRDKDDPLKTLTKSEKKALNDYMHKQVFGGSFTNWESALAKWNEMNPSHAVKIDMANCPNYKNLKEE